jgi:hypothetical protein
LRAVPVLLHVELFHRARFDDGFQMAHGLGRLVSVMQQTLPRGEKFHLAAPAAENAHPRIAAL